LETPASARAGRRPATQWQHRSTPNAKRQGQEGEGVGAYLQRLGRQVSEPQTLTKNQASQRWSQESWWRSRPDFADAATAPRARSPFRPPQCAATIGSLVEIWNWKTVRSPQIQSQFWFPLTIHVKKLALMSIINTQVQPFKARHSTTGVHRSDRSVPKQGKWFGADLHARGVHLQLPDDAEDAADNYHMFKALGPSLHMSRTNTHCAHKGVARDQARPSARPEVPAGRRPDAIR